MTLDKLGILYKTDKSSLTHNYCEKYDELFAHNKDNVTDFLELGIYNGGSLRMWRDYFKNATIHAIDISFRCMFKEDRIKTYLCSQSDKQMLNTLFSQIKFDIILDDGSHQYKDQINSFLYLFEKVKSKGYYIIEDICTSYWNGFGDEPAIDYFKKLIDDVNFYGLKVDNKVDRKESSLLEKASCRKDIESILFLNSIVIIKKR